SQKKSNKFFNPETSAKRLSKVSKAHENIFTPKQTESPCSDLNGKRVSKIQSSDLKSRLSTTIRRVKNRLKSASKSNTTSGWSKKTNQTVDNENGHIEPNSEGKLVIIHLDCWHQGCAKTKFVT